MYSVKSIISKFADYFAKRQGSNLNKLINIFSDEFEEVKDTLELIIAWREIDRAKGVVLEAIGENVNQKRGFASDDVYRVLLKSKIARNLSDGSINHVINVLSVSLNVRPDEVKIVELWSETQKSAALRIDLLPYDAINRTGIDGYNLMDMIRQTVAGGVTVDAVALTGTFEFSDFMKYDEETSFDYGGFDVTFEFSSLEPEEDTEIGLADQTLQFGGRLGAIFTSETAPSLPI